MHYNDREPISVEKLSKSPGMSTKKFIIYLSINLLTILLLIFASTMWYYANENLKNEIGSVKKQCDSVGGLVDEKYKLIANLLKEQYNISIDLSKRTNESFADKFYEKYQLEALFNVSSVDKVGYIGYDTVLECNTGKEDPISMEYHWYYNGNEIDSLNSNEYATHKGNLTIKNLTESDAGNYRCLLTYGHNYKNVTYNLAIEQAYQWVDVALVKKLEDLGYKKIDIGNGKYLGQTGIIADVLPGKIDSDSSMFYILNDNYQETKNFKVFMLHKNLETSWIRSVSGNVPTNALEAGKLANGEILYVGKTGSSFGVIQPSIHKIRMISNSYGDENTWYYVLCLENFQNI